MDTGRSAEKKNPFREKTANNLGDGYESGEKTNTSNRSRPVARNSKGPSRGNGGQSRKKRMVCRVKATVTEGTGPGWVRNSGDRP
jgi:hypothetical protein